MPKSLSATEGGRLGGHNKTAVCCGICGRRSPLFQSAAFAVDFAALQEEEEEEEGGESDLHLVSCRLVLPPLGEGEGGGGRNKRWKFHRI